MTACIERRELSKTAVSAVYRANEVKEQLSKSANGEEHSRPFIAARIVERQAVEALAIHRIHHGC